ncbi:MAG: MBL fold metallo-hydrolase [Chitinophagales bacterium]|nr:MBL fold metallo-hydrolase [Bacteroidota bacterium]MCB9042991.1 MBL fold metallo-hydrolase [Chitinophagales bacterium]
MYTSIKSKPEVHIFSSVLFQTNTTLLVFPTQLLLVDPNYTPQELADIAAFIQQNFPDKKINLFFTHSDYDHVVGYGIFQNAAHGIMSAPMAALPSERKKDILQEIKITDATWYIERSPETLIFPPKDIVIEKDGQLWEIDGYQVRFYFAPGHTADGLVCFVNDICICGDYLCDTEFPFIYHSFEAYRNTLQKLSQLFKQYDTRILLSGHGKVAAKSAEIEHRLLLANQYLEDIEKEVISGIPLDENYLQKQYPFWWGIKKFHHENLALLRKEKSGGS